MNMDFKKIFRTTCSARIYEVSKSPSRSELNKVFEAAGGKRATQLFSGFQRRLPGLNGSYSFSIFKKKVPVHFLIDSDLEEVLFGFILLVVIDDKMAVFTRRALSVDEELSEFSTPIPIKDFMSSLMHEGLDLRKIRARAFSSGVSGCHAKQYEGLSLQDALGTLANSRHLLQSLTAKDKKQTLSIQLNIRKLTRYGGKSTLSQVADWCKIVFDLIDRSNGTNTFLQSYASSRPFSEAGVPKSILFHTWEIEEYLKDLTAESSVGYRLPERTLLDIGQERTDRYINSLSSKLEARYELVEVEADSKWNVVEDLDEEPRVLGTLSLRNQNLHFESARLSRLVIRNEGEIVQIPQAIARQHMFSISFSKPEYFYSAGMTVQDSGIKHSARLALRCLKAFPALTNARSEKGDVSTTGSFDNDSIFHFIDTECRSAKGLLVCDDLGSEWADFIEFCGQRRSIRFLHAKHKATVTAGAAPLHEVVSQALKNLGQIAKDDRHYIGRLTKWTEDHGDLHVPRTRALTVYGNNQECIADVANDSGASRYMILVINFLSKAEYEQEIENLDDGASDHLVQRVWLISSFVSACKEVGVIPEIWCAP